MKLMCMVLASITLFGCSPSRAPMVLPVASECPKPSLLPKPVLLSEQLSPSSAPDDVEKAHVSDLMILTQYADYLHAQINPMTH